MRPPCILDSIHMLYITPLMQYNPPTKEYFPRKSGRQSGRIIHHAFLQSLCPYQHRHHRPCLHPERLMSEHPQQRPRHARVARKGNPHRFFAVVGENVIQQPLRPCVGLFVGLPPLRAPELVVLCEARFEGESGESIGEGRARGSAVTGMDAVDFTKELGVW